MAYNHYNAMLTKLGLPCSTSFHIHTTHISGLELYSDMVAALVQLIGSDGVVKILNL